MTRIRAGRGFVFRDAAGVRVTDPELLDRIADLVTPPSWNEVWIAPYPNGHIQATGVDENGSFGLSTLLCWHARVLGRDRVRLRFPAKSGHAWESELHDRDLAVLVGGLKRRGGRSRLLAWHHAGRWHPLSAEEINADLRARTGGEFSAKDSRTLRGTVAAALSLARTGPKPTERERTKAVVEAVRATARVLENTPAVARSSYIDPRLLDRYAHGETIDASHPGSAETQLRALLFG